jgi:hypothetical protein
MPKKYSHKTHKRSHHKKHHRKHHTRKHRGGRGYTTGAAAELAQSSPAPL